MKTPHPRRARPGILLGLVVAVVAAMTATGASAVEVVGQLQPPPQESADRLPSSLAG